MPRKASISLGPQNHPVDTNSFETVTVAKRKSEDYVTVSMSEDPPSPSSNKLARAADFAKTLFLFQPRISLDEGNLEEVAVYRDSYYQALSEADKSLAAAQQVGTYSLIV